jgi:hypothetical protein
VHATNNRTFPSTQLGRPNHSLPLPFPFPFTSSNLSLLARHDERSRDDPVDLSSGIESSMGHRAHEAGHATAVDQFAGREGESGADGWERKERERIDQLRREEYSVKYGDGGEVEEEVLHRAAAS